MKALTIIQPWATLIASGHKMNETRSWKTNYRGEVLIHAGKNPKRKAARSRATTMNKSEKYSEIILLGQMLQERKIEHEQHDLYDGYQIIVPLPEPTKEISVIEHQCSYGSIMNLLEIWADGSIQGYLSAKQTLRIIERVKARESPR